MWRRSARLLLIAAIWACSGPGRPVSAQEVDEPEDGTPAVPQARGKAVGMYDRQLDRWLFGIDGEAETAHGIAEASLRMQVAFINRVCRLTREQRKKLWLAGRRNLERHFDRVREFRERVRTAGDFNRLRGHLQEARELGRGFPDKLFDDESLFAKTLRTALDQEQWTRYQQQADRRLLAWYQSRVNSVSRTLQRDLALSESQRLRLLDVLVEETLPPRNSGPADYSFVVYQASRIPEDKLRPILDEEQWSLLRREFDKARRREPLLRKLGLLPEDPPAEDSIPGSTPRGGKERAGSSGTPSEESGAAAGSLPPSEKRAS